MKPLQNHITISQMGKNIKQLEEKHFSGPQSIRLLKLLLGVDVQMLLTTEGIYHANGFYQISRMLRYQHLHTMLKEIQDSGLFIIGWNKTETQILWFASPLYLSVEDVKKHSETQPADDGNAVSNDAELGGLFSGSFTSNITGKVNGLPPAPPSIIALTGKIVLPGGTAPAKACATLPSHRTLSKAERDVAYEKWLRSLTDESAQILFEETRKRVRSVVGCEEDEAKEIFRSMMCVKLKERFIVQDRFFTAKAEGRLAWLTNVLKHSSIDRVIKETARYVQKKHQKQSAQQLRQGEEDAKNNRPISPYEWQDPETGKRYYADPYDGTTWIPEGVAPRPSDTAYLSVENQWTE